MVDIPFNGEFSDEALRHVFKLCLDVVAPGDLSVEPLALSIENTREVWVQSRLVDRPQVLITRGLVDLLMRYFQRVCGASDAIAYRKFSSATFVTERWLNLRHLKRGLIDLEFGVGLDESLERHVIAFALAIMAIRYLMFHEIAHHYMGHLNYLRVADASLLEKQAMERDADLFASVYSGLGADKTHGRPPFHGFNFLSPFIEGRFGRGTTQPYLAAYAIVSIYHLMGDKVWTLDQGLNRGHPPGMVRKAFSAANLLNVNGRSSTSTKAIIELAVRESQAHLNNLLGSHRFDAATFEDLVELERYEERLIEITVRLRESLRPYSYPGYSYLAEFQS